MDDSSEPKGAASMWMPVYDGLVEDWKLDLISTRAKLMGFRSCDMPDVLQELVLELLDFRYDPERAEGAIESTVVTAVIDNHLRNMIRSATRYEERLQRKAQSVTEFSKEKVDLRSIDVFDAIAGLDDREQVVCTELAQGLSKTRIARRHGWGWHTVDGSIAKIRDRFRNIGLDGWVKG